MIESEETGYFTTSPSVSFKPYKRYKIDFSKVTELEDVIAILKAMDLTFTKDLKDFDLIEKYAIEES